VRIGVIGGSSLELEVFQENESFQIWTPNCVLRFGFILNFWKAKEDQQDEPQEEPKDQPQAETPSSSCRSWEAWADAPEEPRADDEEEDEVF